MRSVSAQIEAVLGPRPAAAAATSASSRDAPASLLVVDDNETNRDILSRLLERQGHRVSSASGGEEALARLANGRFDLVLLDILMPGLTGFEVLQRMKADPALAQVPVIFISALDDASGKAQAFRAGGVDYVTKPFQAEEVAARVESQLKISRLQRDLARQNQELTRKNEELVRAQQRADLVFSALTDALPGTVLDGKYRLDEKIGAGGFAVVFRGLHLGLDLSVAIKVFRPMSGNDTPEALERFRQEGIAASRIKHPNAVEILDNGISSTGIAYLVMELMEGRTLGAELRERGPLSPRRVAADPGARLRGARRTARRRHRPSRRHARQHLPAPGAQGRGGEAARLRPVEDADVERRADARRDDDHRMGDGHAGLHGAGAAAEPAFGRPFGRLQPRRDHVPHVVGRGGRSGPDEGGNYALAMMQVTSDPLPLPALGVEVPEDVDRLVS